MFKQLFINRAYFTILLVIGLGTVITGCDTELKVSPSTGYYSGAFYNDIVVDHTINLTLKTDLPEGSTGVVSFNRREWSINADGSVNCNQIAPLDIHNTGCDLTVDVENGFLSFSYNYNTFSETADTLRNHNQRSTINNVTLDFEGYDKHVKKCENSTDDREKSKSKWPVRTDEKQNRWFNRYVNQLQKVTCATAYMTYGLNQTQLRIVQTYNTSSYGTMRITVKAGTVDDVYLRYMKANYYGFLSLSPVSVVKKNGYEIHSFDFDFDNNTLDAAEFWPYVDIIVKPLQGVSLDDTQLSILDSYDKYELVAGETPLILNSNESYLALRANFHKFRSLRHKQYTDLTPVNKVISFNRPSSFNNATILSAQHSINPKVKNTDFRPPLLTFDTVVAAPKTANINVAIGSQDEVRLTFNENVTLMSVNQLVEQEYNSTDTVPGRIPHYTKENVNSGDLHIGFTKHSANHGFTCLRCTVQSQEDLDLNFNFWDAEGKFKSNITQRVFTLSSSFVDSANNLVRVERSRAYGEFRDLWYEPTNILLLPATGKLIPIKNILHDVRSDIFNNLNTNTGFGSAGVINTYLEHQSDVVKGKQVVINKSNRNKRYKYVFTGAYVKSKYKPRLVKSGTATASLSCEDVISYGEHNASIPYLHNVKKIECEIADFSGKGNLSVAMTFDSVVNRKADLLFAVNLPVYTNIVMDDAITVVEADLIHYDLRLSSGIIGGLNIDDFTLLTTGDVTADIVEVVPDTVISGKYRVTISSAIGDGTLKLAFVDTLEASGENGQQVDFDNTSFADFPTILIGNPVTLTTSTIEYLGKSVLDTEYAEFTLTLTSPVSELTPANFELITSGSVVGEISDITFNLNGRYSVNLTSLSGEGTLTVKVLASSIIDDNGASLGVDFISSDVTVDVKAYVMRAVIVSW